MIIRLRYLRRVEGCSQLYNPSWRCFTCYTIVSDMGGTSSVVSNRGGRSEEQEAVMCPRGAFCIRVNEIEMSVETT